MGKKFVQLFDIKYLERVHLYKDVGMIPALLHKKYDISSTIVFYDNEKNRDLESIEEGIYLKRISTNLINKIKLFEFVLSPMVQYLLMNAKKIDYLMLFHLKKQNYFYRLIYKMLNSKGKIYLKLDLDTRDIESFQTYRNEEIKSLNLFKNSMTFKEYILCMKRKIGFKFMKKELSKFDIISAETKFAILKINEATSNIISNKLFYLTNGFLVNDESLNLRKSFSEKENMIITVGRIGSNQKNSEMFLKAIEKVDLKDWEINFIGPINEKFNTVINCFFEKNPKLLNKVHFVGNISDKTKLYEWYARSKIFCLTSKHEGFPLVFPEAIYFGNYVVSTKIGADKDITDDGALGNSVDIDDFESLALYLQKIIDNENIIEEKFQDIIRHCEDNYMWENIIDTLYEKLVTE